MSEEIMKSEITALSIAQGVEAIYNSFTDAVKELATKKKGKKMTSSLAHWLAGSHIRTEKDVICDKFIMDMESYLEMFDLSLEGLDEASVQEACSVIVDCCSQSFPADSNSTTDLMRRAMISKVIKYLPYLPKDKLAEVRDRVDSSYRKWQRLPVEKEFLKEAEKLLK